MAIAAHRPHGELADTYHHHCGSVDLAIGLDPNYTFAYLNEGNALRAPKHYEQAIRIDPNFIMAYENKGVALRELGRETEARQADEKARQLGIGQRFQQK